MSMLACNPLLCSSLAPSRLPVHPPLFHRKTRSEERQRENVEEEDGEREQDVREGENERAKCPSKARATGQCRSTKFGDWSYTWRMTAFAASNNDELPVTLFTTSCLCKLPKLCPCKCAIGGVGVDQAVF
eukprot:6179911-Pleurochrysis_carterae.AAC.1